VVLQDKVLYEQSTFLQGLKDIDQREVAHISSEQLCLVENCVHQLQGFTIPG